MKIQNFVWVDDEISGFRPKQCPLARSGPEHSLPFIAHTTYLEDTDRSSWARNCGPDLADLVTAIWRLAVAANESGGVKQTR